jgi:hypothetical protein
MPSGTLHAVNSVYILAHGCANQFEDWHGAEERVGAVARQTVCAPRRFGSVSIWAKTRYCVHICAYMCIYVYMCVCVCVCGADP